MDHPVEPRGRAVDLIARTGDTFTIYDAAQMLTYARLIDADRDGVPWQTAAETILFLDIVIDPAAAERCWRSHLDRALWTISTPGLQAAAAANAAGWFPAPDPDPAPATPVPAPSDPGIDVTGVEDDLQA